MGLEASLRVGILSQLDMIDNIFDVLDVPL